MTLWLPKFKATIKILLWESFIETLLLLDEDSLATLIFKFGVFAASAQEHELNLSVSY